MMVNPLIIHMGCFFSLGLTLPVVYHTIDSRRKGMRKLYSDAIINKLKYDPSHDKFIQAKQKMKIKENLEGLVSTTKKGGK